MREETGQLICMAPLDELLGLLCSHRSLLIWEPGVSSSHPMVLRNVFDIFSTGFPTFSVEFNLDSEHSTTRYSIDSCWNCAGFNTQELHECQARLQWIHAQKVVNPDYVINYSDTCGPP